MSGFEAFLWALTQQESGGNYGAVGPWVHGDRAYGRYQVMGANVPSWTARYYGRRLTPSQYLHNRAAQDAVVRGVLGGYYKKYGARGAAAMWYSGQPNPNKSYGNPPVYKYVSSVMSRASRYRGQSTAGSGGSSSFSAGPGWSPEAVNAKLDEKTLAEMYGLSSRLINSSKELKKLFNKAVAGSWSATRFQANLKNTKWWRDQSDTLRKYLVLKYTDPSTWNQKRQNAIAELSRMATEVGLSQQLWGQVKKSGTVYSGLLHDAVYNKLALGWTDARLKDWLGSHAKAHGGIMYGEAGEAFDKLHQIAYMNGMQYGSYYERAARNIVSGKSTLETEEAKIRRDAAATYSAYADQIKAGQNVLDLAAPYIKSVSQILEIPESDIDLFDKYVHNAMSGGHAGENFPLWDFQRIVRGDPRWKKTNNARESIMGVAHQVARDFGMAF